MAPGKRLSIAPRDSYWLEFRGAMGGARMKGFSGAALDRGVAVR